MIAETDRIFPKTVIGISSHFMIYVEEKMVSKFRHLSNTLLLNQNHRKMQSSKWGTG